MWQYRRTTEEKRLYRQRCKPGLMKDPASPGRDAGIVEGIVE